MRLVAYFDQQTVCGAPICWLKYTTEGVVLLGYTGRLTSIFTDPELSDKLDNVKELASRNDLIYITEADSAAQVSIHFYMPRPLNI